MPKPENKESSEQKRHIRYHRKSRTGCFSCKKRRVKCDEVHPTCGNCARREVECIWDQPNIRSSPEGGELMRSVSPTPRYGDLSPPSPVNMNSLMLIHHYTIATYPSLYSKPVCANTCKVVIPQLSFSSPFLMHSMLACAGLHLETLHMEDPDAPKFALMAATHKNAALSLLPSLVGVSDAHLLGIGLLTMFTLCSSLRGPAPTIFSMLKTIHNIWHGMQGYTFADQSLKVLDWVHLLNNLPDNPNDPFPIHLFSIHLPTSDFPDPEEVEDPEVADAYKSAVDALCTARPFSYSGYELIAAIKWAELFSTKFLELLLEKRPRALVILYHYCSMIHNVSYCWWAGDTEGRLNYVRELLDDKWKDCLDTIRSPFVEVASISSGFLTRPVY